MANTVNKNKTHCPNGHELIPENCVASMLKIGKRQCKICKSLREKSKRNPNGNLPPALRTHCPKGHPLEGDNLVASYLKIGKRRCRICNNEQARILQSTKESKINRLTWQRRNKNKISRYNKKWNRENRRQYSAKWDNENKEKRKNIQKKYNDKPERRAYQKQWQRLNPRSGNDRPEDVKEAMINARIRDNNTCQWSGCNRTPKEMSIQVHHIFPMEEYPGLASVEQYMICYCAEHHYLWHHARGDLCQYVLKGSIPRMSYVSNQLSVVPTLFQMNVGVN